MKRAVLAGLCLLLLTGCAPRTESTTIFAMDTVMELTAYGPKAGEAVERAVGLVGRLEGELSAQRADSDVYRLNHAQGEPVAICPETRDALAEALELCAATEGALDVTIYPAVEAWGFPSGAYRVPDAAELEDLRERVNYGALSVGPETAASDPLERTSSASLPAGMALDLGAVGKGFTGDRIAALWRDMGVTSGLLNLGGNVQCLGAKPDGSDWTVAVRTPAEGGGFLAYITGRDMAVVTSGAYQRYFELEGETYHHILDPATCAPAESGLQSVTIVGERGAVCDGLSTAVYVMGMDRAVALWRQRRDFDMVLYTDAGELYVTAGLEGRAAPGEGLELRVIHE